MGVASYPGEFENRAVRTLVVSIQIILERVEQVCSDGDGSVPEDLGFVAVHVENDHHGGLRRADDDGSATKNVGIAAVNILRFGDVIIGLAHERFRIASLAVFLRTLVIAFSGARVGVVGACDVGHRVQIVILFAARLCGRACPCGSGEWARQDAEQLEEGVKAPLISTIAAVCAELGCSFGVFVSPVGVHEGAKQRFEQCAFPR